MIHIEEREIQVLLSLLAYEFCGGALPTCVADLNWDKLLKLADDHAITALLYSGVKRLDGVPEQIVNRTRVAAVSSAMRSHYVLQVQQEIIELLMAEKIPGAVLKGMSVACYYPHPELRMSGDIDLLVSNANLEAVCQKLTTIGFAVDHDIEMHIDLRRADIEVELHRVVSMFPDTEKARWTSAYMEQALQHVQWQQINEFSFPVLSINYQLVSLLAHIERHMSRGGIGLRQICDWAVMVHYLREEIGLESVEILEQCGLLKFASILTRMCEKYIGFSKLEWCQNVSEDLLDTTLEDILTAGNFHAQRGENILSVVMMSNRGIAQGDRISPLVQYVQYVMQKMRKLYPWARSSLWMPFFCVFFPIQWLIRALNGKRKRANLMKTMKIAKFREKLLRDMKLYQ